MQPVLICLYDLEDITGAHKNEVLVLFAAAILPDLSHRSWSGTRLLQLFFFIFFPKKTSCKFIHDGVRKYNIYLLTYLFTKF